MTIPTISTLPTAPARTDAPATFITRADAFLAALVTMQSELNTSIGAMNTDIAGVNTDATAAASSASAAAASASSAASSAGAELWVSGQAYAEGDAAISGIDYLTYRANTATSGTTDPSASGDWVQINITETSTDTLSNKTLAATTLSGQLTGADQTVSAINLKDYGEITNALGNTTGAKTIDLTLGNSVTATTTGATTWTFSNPTASDELCSFSIKLVNGGSAAQTWPTSVDWPAATAPTLTASGTDVLVFITCDGGTTWYGFVAGLALA